MNLSKSVTCSSNNLKIDALRSFKSFLTDPSNRLSSWQGENCCSWKGIKCSSSGHVVVVNLRNPHPIEVKININKEVVSNSQCTSDFSLKGNKSPLLFTLDHMKHLYLSYNNFVFSKLPAEISNLTKLTYLNLSNAMFQDSIAMQFTNLTSLRSLDLSCANLVPNYSSVSVSLTFPLKLDFGSSLLSFISYGYLSSPNLRKNSDRAVSAPLSPIWTRNPAVTIDLVSMFAVPWSKLTLLDICFTWLFQNRLEGNVPISICQISSLEYLNLEWNDLTGRLPLCILQLPKLSSLYIQRNRLNGNMPFSLFRKSRLDEISLGTSGLSAEIDDPDQPFVQTFQPKILEFTSCNMRGKIPDFFSNFTSLVEVVAEDTPLQPLPENPTVAQIKSHSNEKLKKFKAKTVIQNSVADSIFSKIIACETANEAWEKLKNKYQGSDLVRQMQILNLKRDFESLRMQEDEVIAKYSDKNSLLVCKIWLLGEDFKDDRIVEKILLTIPERFESKISSLKESKDLSTISIKELISALQAQEQRRAFRLRVLFVGSIPCFQLSLNWLQRLALEWSNWPLAN
ncbi:LRR receptor-like serine/threonine-protein kinase FLS2 [Capsicum annuum]|uniref:LRR receptor-like serine/threonine-protein kinase FLS2 n=1 Tax=Capsicum annuum TaxID=4072 RepID=UPI001FB0F4E3|nr:LRR receptor-like serine/threonine-protein kinase FLS2 [Capsicum annuum]